MKLNVLACEKNRKLSSNRPQGTLVLKISHFKITGCGNTGLYTWAGCCATVALQACSNQIRWQANLVFKTKTDTFALHCEHICFFRRDGLTGPLLYVNTFSSLCLQCSFCHHSVFSFDGRWCQCFTCFWCFLSNILVSIQFYLFSPKKVWLGLVSHWTKLCPLLQMWCSSSTFTSAGSIESIPTGSMSSVPAE